MKPVPPMMAILSWRMGTVVLLAVRRTMIPTRRCAGQGARPAAGGREGAADACIMARLDRVSAPGGVPSHMSDILAELAATLEARKGAAAEESYVASLYARGLDAILKKVGEEAAETIIAAKDGDDAALVHEVADLWFHTLVLLSQRGLHPRAVLAELRRRTGVSGHVEKAARG